MISIEDYAFHNCSTSGKIAFSPSITSIGYYSFYQRSSLKIGLSAFEDCKSLEQIIFPSSVNIINDDSFKGCLSLKKITIPSSIKKKKNRKKHF